MSENRKPHVIALRTAAVLLILTLFTSSIVSGRFARYTASAAGQDSARVASFCVTEEGEMEGMLKVRVRPGYTEEHLVTVRNNSEVSIEYAVAAVNEYQNLPLEFTISDGESDSPTAILAPGDAKAVKLKIYWDEAKADDAYIGMVDLVQLTLTAAQID